MPPPPFPTQWDLGDIDGMIVLPGKASIKSTDRPSDYWLTLPRKSGLVKPSIPYWLSWVVIFMTHILSVMTS